MQFLDTEEVHHLSFNFQCAPYKIVLEPSLLYDSIHWSHQRPVGHINIKGLPVSIKPSQSSKFCHHPRKIYALNGLDAALHFAADVYFC